MITPDLPSSEQDRLDILRQQNILDSLPEQSYDDIIYLASNIIGTPISLISFVDADRQWFKAKLGLGATETSREISFCGHAILQNEVFIVEDTLKDERFADNPLVTGGPSIRFYAGAPIETTTGHKLGTVCIIDTVPRQLTCTECECLIRLARQVSSQLELDQARREAISAHDSKSLFLATMSHEIRTPMNAIASCTDLLLDSVEDDNALQLLSLMRDSSNSLMTLINEVLDLSKIQLESIEISTEIFNLHKLAEDVVGILNVRTEHDTDLIDLDISDNTPDWIVSDSGRLRQIFYNLIGNAVKFCDKKVTVRLQTESWDHSTLHFSVTDDGQGIAPNDQEHIFEKFTQINNKSSKEFASTGLGLAICKSLCIAMEGQLTLESTAGNGAKFSVRLPLVLGKPVVESLQSGRLSTVAPDMGRDYPLSILVAEDNEVNQLLLNAMLGKLGYSATIVSNGEEALEALEVNSYDVILMDINMPIMDGISATKKIRALKIVQPTIVALTANAFASDRDIALKAGMDNFLTKPISLEAVAKALQNTSLH